MKPAITITLIICGTAVLIMPALAALIHLMMGPGLLLMYFGSGALMIAVGVIGSFMPERLGPVRGFDVATTRSGA